MKNIMVLDSPDGSVSGLIGENLRKLKNSGVNGRLSLRYDSPPGARAKPDLIVVTPKAARGASRQTGLSCGILLVPGNAPEAATAFDAGCIVSYGMSTRDSVTLSSIDKDSVMLSVQRELPTVSGEVLERQDIPARRPGRVSPEDALASAAALLVMGVPAGDL